MKTNIDIIVNPHDSATFNAQFDAPVMPTWLADAPPLFDEFPIDESTYHADADGVVAHDAMPHDIGQDWHPDADGVPAHSFPHFLIHFIAVS